MSRTKQETLLLEERIEQIRKRNEEIKRRHLEVEADKQNAAKLNALVQITSPTEDWPIGRRSSPDSHGTSRFRYSEQNRAQQSSSTGGSAKCDTFGERDGAPLDSDRSLSQQHHRHHHDKQQQQQQQQQQHQQQPQWSGRSRGRSRGAFARERDRKHSLRPSGGRGVLQPEYDAWRAERNRIDSDRISRQRTTEGHWRREWDNEKLTQEEDVREAASVPRGDGSRRTNMARNPYGDHTAHTEDCVRSGEHSSFRSSRVPGRVRGGHGVSRGCRGNTRGTRHGDSFPALDSREESAAAAHSERSVISVGESLKISVPNNSPTSVRHVKVNAPIVPGTGRVGPRQTLRISYSSQSEDEAPSHRVELQPNRTSFSKDKALSDSCSHSTVSAVSKPPLPPSAGVKLDSEPKPQRVKRLEQDSKVKKREKKEINVSEISKCVEKEEEAAVLARAGCQKETESGGEDSWEDIATSGNDSACEELSPHSNTDCILDVTSTKVKSKMPENTGEMLQNREFEPEVLQHTEVKPEVLQNTEVNVGMLQTTEMKPEMLHSPEVKPDVLQDTKVRSGVIQNTEVRSDVLQNTEVKSDVLQNTEMRSEMLQNTEMRAEVLQDTELRSEVLQNTEMKPEMLHSPEVKPDVLQDTKVRSGVIQNTEVRSDVLQNTEVKSDVLQNTEMRPEVLQNTEMRAEVLQDTRVRSEVFQNTEKISEVLQDTEMRSEVLQDTEVRSEVLQNTEMISEVLQDRTVRSEVLQDTEVRSEVLQNTEMISEVLQDIKVRSEVLQDTEVRSEVLPNTEMMSEVLQNTEVKSDVLQNTEVRSELPQTVGSILNNDNDDSTEVMQVTVNKNVPDTVMQDIVEKRCVSDGSTEFAELKDASEICFEKSHSDTLVQTKAQTVNETTELTEIENISLIIECKEERLESEIKVEPEERCRQNEEPGKVDTIETVGSAAANIVPEEKQGPV